MDHVSSIILGHEEERSLEDAQHPASRDFYVPSFVTFDKGNRASWVGVSRWTEKHVVPRTELAALVETLLIIPSIGERFW